ncbi:MAG: glycosyltransferase family A protein [Bacteroidota bacterium]|nr:glycosyltransferase family A protein [Bacteroidota bacterium]
MTPIISIIIPCFNHGQYLRDAIESIPKDISGIEIIIINDGSTEPLTVDILSKLAAEGYTVLNQLNQGLGKSRNNGIKAANGKYILPLDADNKLFRVYFEKGIEYLKLHPEISVLYADAVYFGDKAGKVSVPDFNLQQLITGNYIDACAIFRKSAWEAVGGYDEQMPFMGVEDWEFWLNLSFHGFKFHHFAEPGFYYRVTNDSMIKKDTAPNFNILKNYIEKKHSYYINYNAPGEYIAAKFKANPPVFLFKLILLTYFPKKYKELVERLKIKRI